jgi:CRP-like cAMP-binding protein
MSGLLAKYARYEQVLRKEPGSRTLAECCVLDEWAQGVPLLEHLDENSRLELCQAAVIKEYAANRTIVSTGKRAERMFVVLSGQVSIMVDGLRGPKCLASLGPGGTFGELELLTGEKHTSSAVAVNPVIMIIVDAETFGSTLAPTYGKELFDRARFLQTTTPFR